MNKNRVDGYLGTAVLLLKDDNIGVATAKKGETEKTCIEKTFRGCIASFGAAITMGSLKAAVAFYTKKGKASVDRQNLMKMIYRLVVPESEQNDKYDLLPYVIGYKDDSNELKEKICDAAIALKLAMNMYELV